MAGLEALVEKYKAAIEVHTHTYNLHTQPPIDPTQHEPSIHTPTHQAQGEGLTLLELVNDCRPRKLEFERLVAQGVRHNVAGAAQVGGFGALLPGAQSMRFALGMSLHDEFRVV